MNRKIKFRMKDKQGEWQYVEMTCSIIEALKDPVIPGGIDIDENTIGQYTGIDDKNGKEIYEGDIVYCQTKYGKAKAIIKFIDGKFVAYWDSILTHPQNGHCIACYEINKRFEVIGNIYEDIELLGGE